MNTSLNRSRTGNTKFCFLNSKCCLPGLNNNNIHTCSKPMDRLIGLRMKNAEKIFSVNIVDWLYK